jgi:outer membrane protein OmpA-like peptidoglycan-associated protein
MRRFHLALALSLPLASISSFAAAQPGADIDLQTFRPATDSRGFITVNASQVLGHGEPSFGLVTTWGYGLLRFEDGESSYEVEHLITPTLVGAYGLRLAGVELQVGASLPFAIMSGDRQPNVIGEPGDPAERFRFDGQGLGDAAFHLKWRLHPASRGPVGAAIIASVSLPTASQSDSWLGDGEPVPQLIGVTDLERGRFRFGANLGLRWREGRRFADDQPMMDGRPIPLTGGVIEVGSSLPFGLAAAYAVVPERFDAVAEVFGAVPLTGENYFPVEALGGIKVYLARNSYLSLGAGTGLLRDQGGNPDLRAYLGIVFEPSVGDRDGDGIVDDIDACPDQPEDKDGFQDQDGCPDPDNDRERTPDRRIPDSDDACPDDPEDVDGFEDEDGCPDPDNDGDGILDIDDLCPDVAEDVDGWEDQDGCPEPDNDTDGILDVADACPRRDGQTRKETAEVYNALEDEDGCPDRGGPVIETDTEIEILETIHFEFDSAVIKPQSHHIVRAVARTILFNPKIRKVEVQGHTDERGSDNYNLDLSQRRAQAVVDFMVAEGVSPKKLIAQGYGESQPLLRKSTPAAWAKNRRVEFIILDRRK